MEEIHRREIRGASEQIRGRVEDGIHVRPMDRSFALLVIVADSRQRQWKELLATAERAEKEKKRLDNTDTWWFTMNSSRNASRGTRGRKHGIGDFSLPGQCAAAITHSRLGWRRTVLNSRPSLAMRSGVLRDCASKRVALARGAPRFRIFLYNITFQDV